MGEKKGFFNFLKIDSLFDHLTSFIESKIEIYKIELKEELAQSLSRVAVVLLFSFLAFFFILFLNVAIGYYLSAILNSLFYGFLIISGFYLLIFTGLFLLRRQLGLREKFEKMLMDWLKPEKENDDR